LELLIILACVVAVLFERIEQTPEEKRTLEYVIYVFFGVFILK